MPESEQQGGKLFQSAADIEILWGEAGSKSRLKRAVLFNRAPHNPEQNCEVAAGVESMVKASETPRIFMGIEGCNGPGRRWTEVLERPLNCSQYDLHIAVREGRRDEANNLPIAWIVVTMDELHGIVRQVFFFWKFGEKAIEMKLQRWHICSRGLQGASARVRARRPVAL